MIKIEGSDIRDFYRNLTIRPHSLIMFCTSLCFSTLGISYQSFGTIKTLYVQKKLKIGHTNSYLFLTIRVYLVLCVTISYNIYLNRYT